MAMTKKYTDQQWEFIRDFELADPTFAEFIARRDEHDAKFHQESYGMSSVDIRRLEKELGDGERRSAEEAWDIISYGHEVEINDLLYWDYKLRERSEAAWRVRPLQRVKEAFRSFLRELSLPE